MTVQENQLAKLCFSMCHHFSTRTGINALETASTVSWSPLELLDFQVSQNLFYLQEIFPNLSKQLHSNYDCVHDRPVPPSPKQGTKICAFFFLGGGTNRDADSILYFDSRNFFTDSKQCRYKHNIILKHFSKVLGTTKNLA